MSSRKTIILVISVLVIFIIMGTVAVRRVTGPSSESIVNEPTTSLTESSTPSIPSSVTSAAPVATTDDFQAVDTYLRASIATIAPQSPVLGGRWYVTQVIVNSQTKTGIVRYEDGHIEAVDSFRYTRIGDQVMVEWLK